MHDDHEDIAKLLRIKRFEQPPREYFENFLEEFKDRQRAQLLREPAWRIGWDRLCAFFGEQLPARIGYGLASTAVLVAAGMVSLNILEMRPVEEVAASKGSPSGGYGYAGASPAAAAQTASLNLDSQVQLPDLPSLAHTVSFYTPRSVLDTRPVSFSYAPPSSF